MDHIDLKILAMLEKDARLANAAIGEAVGLTASSVYERIKKLEKQGAIKGYMAIVDPAAVGRPITAFIRIMLGASHATGYDQAKKSVQEVCDQEPEVLECHHVAGEDCYILKVRTESPKELERLVERLRTDTEVQRTITAIVFSTVKETLAVVPAVEETQ